MAETTTSATETAKPVSIAVIFDSRATSERKPGFLSSKEIRNFSATAKFIPEPTIPEGATPFIDPAKTLELRHGANLGVLTTAWGAHLELNDLKKQRREGSRFGDFLDSGAFKIFQPTKGKDGSVYADYKPDDALELIEATLSVADIDKYLEGEKRDGVIQAATGQRQAIEEEILSRQTAYA
jgi:hypothetical protein